MSTDITTFVFPKSNHEVRSLIIDEEPWFVAKDVCDVLELSNVSNVMTRLDADEKGIHSMDTPGGLQQMSVINESGLYALILRSDKPKAKDFRRWVTGEVLPSIRKNGSYALVAQKDEQIALLMHERIDMREIMLAIRQDALVTRECMTRVLGIMERNEPKIATHDLFVASDLEMSMTETSAVLGFRNVCIFTAALRSADVFTTQKYTVTYGKKSFKRFRNTPTADWRRVILVRLQGSGKNTVTVPYATPEAIAPLYYELIRHGHNLSPLPSVDEQRKIVAEVRQRKELDSYDIEYALHG